MNEATNREIGRRKGNRTITRAEYELFCAEVKAAGLRLKVNTVVSRLNLAENFVDFLSKRAARSDQTHAGL